MVESDTNRTGIPRVPVWHLGGHRLRAGLAAGAAVLLCCILAWPGDLALSERLDPLSSAEVMVSKGRHRQALKLLDALPAEAMDPWAGRRVGLQSGICQLEMREYREALAAFRGAAPAFEPLSDYLMYWQAECLAGLGLPDSAVAYYSRTLEADPTTMLRDRVLLARSRLDASTGRHDLAVEGYRALIGRSRREPEALVGLAAALEAGGDTTQARSVRLQLMRDHPKRDSSLAAANRLGTRKSAAELFYSGRVYAVHKQTNRAIRNLRRVMSATKNRTWRGRAQYELGKAYFGRGSYRTALRTFDRAYRDYQVPMAQFKKAACSVKLGQDRKASEQYLVFADQHPHVPGAAEALWNAGMANERMGRRARAREIFLLLASRYPKSEFADNGRWRAGFALYRVGDWAASARAFLDLAAHTEEHYLRDQGFYWAAKALQQAGEQDEADRWMRKAAEGFPSSYYSSRAWALDRAEDATYPSVVKIDDATIEKGYERSRHLVKGDLLASLGLYGDARREYQRARWAHQDDLFALGDLLQRLERIGAMNQALRVSNQIASLERERGIPVTLTSFRRLYPTYYWGEISRAAKETGLDPNLILAVIRQESAFDREAESSAGARGLMQVMPTTGRAMARKARMKRFREEDLWEARTSIRLGSQHLLDHFRYFRRQDGKRLSLALSAYNAGLEAAKRWSRRLRGQDVDEFVESIPYRETRNYVKLVYRNYQVYSYLQSAQHGGSDGGGG